MKRIRAVISTAIFLLCVNAIGYSQRLVEVFKTTIIEPYYLTITVNKTSNLIFPYSIKSVDRGSPDVLAQKAKGIENVLLVKAGKENFAETNLSVITSDGKLYSFVLSYSSNPSLLNISFTKDTSLEGTLSLLQSGNNEAQMLLTAERIANENRMLYGLRDHKFGMKLQLDGIYTKGDVVFYQLQIENESNISYDIDMVRFYIRDKKKTKRTASQELELQPLYMYGDTTIIKGQSNRTFVFALPKFTIPDKKYLSIQLMEQNGGRHLQLRVHSRTIVKAELVN
jgi:conjugative transposon TraN protein